MEVRQQIHIYLSFQSCVHKQDLRGDQYGSASAPNVSTLDVEKGCEEGGEILAHDMEIAQLLWTMNIC